MHQLIPQVPLLTGTSSRALLVSKPAPHYLTLLVRILRDSFQSLQSRRDIDTFTYR
jgi:hypothetical protein